MTAIGVLGAGPWGATLAWMLGERGHDVTLWSSDAAKVERMNSTRKAQGTRGIRLGASVTATTDLAAALRPDLLFLSTPPTACGGLLTAMAPHTRPEQQIVHTVKGLAPSGQTVTTLIPQLTNVLQVGALVGPLVLSDLWRGADGAAVVGSDYQAVIDAVTGAMVSDTLRIYGNLDRVGVELGGALRAPVVLAAGVLAGAKAGESLTATLLTRAVAEGGRLADRLGGQRATLAGMAGVGDWMLGARDPRDPLMKAGARLVAGQPLGFDEAERRIRTVDAEARKRGVELPITHGMVRLLDGQPFADVLRSLMTRRSRAEAE